MRKTKEMISVIIPMFNAEDTIIEALDSVRDQTVGSENFEIIVIDDGSTDNSSHLVENYIQENPELNILLMSQENKGVSSARNVGLMSSEGDYIAFLDADDVWLPEKTEKQIEYLRNDNFLVDFIATTINENKIFFPYFSKNNLAEVNFRKLLIRNGIPTPTVIFKKKILENTGFFDENQRYLEDHNFWLKISLQNTMYILDERLVIAGKGKRTFGVSGLSADISEMAKGAVKNLREMCDMKEITLPEYILYRIFYKAKYFLLLFRNLL
jgi:glycosyltransferase involved in cell wall biosynthesis